MLPDHVTPKVPQVRPVTIGEASRLSGVSAKMLRYYESLGLISKVARSEGGYRMYGDADVHTLRFIKRSRDLGFSIHEITELVNLWQNRSRASATVKLIAQKHVDELNTRIEAMQAMQRTLQNLLVHCHGDDRPDCPILDDLAGKPAPVSEAACCATMENAVQASAASAGSPACCCKPGDC